MRTVLVNDRLLNRPRTGVGQYLNLIVAHWPADAQVRLVGFHSQRLLSRPTIPATIPTLGPLSALAPVNLAPLPRLFPPSTTRWRRWLGWARPYKEWLYSALMRWERKRGGYGAFFEPNNLPTIEACPTVTTLHDLSVLELPTMHPPDRVAFWQSYLERGIRWTNHWICDSHATADALHRLLHVAPTDTTVVPLAARWTEAPADWEPAALRRQLHLPDRYLVCLGTIEPRKNLLRLLDAYALLPASFREQTPLLFVGLPGWGPPSFWDGLGQHPMARHVFTTGYVSDTQAAGIVFGSLGLLYPSLYEGFGLPPLEAMALGVPVAASTAASVREVCQDAALLLNPADTEGWRDAILQIVETGPERQRLQRVGTQRVRQFCWHETARQHAAVLNRHAA